MQDETTPNLLPDWPMRHNFYSSIGQAISFWADMESKIVIVCSRLLRSEEKKTGLVLYSIINTNAWLSIVTELFPMDDKCSHIAQSWNKIAERIRSHNDTRVRLAHHSKWFAPADEIALRASPYDTRGKWRNSPPLTIDSVMLFTQEVAKIGDDLDNLIERMDAALLPTLPGISGQQLAHPDPRTETPEHQSPTEQEVPPQPSQA